MFQFVSVCFSIGTNLQPDSWPDIQPDIWPDIGPGRGPQILVFSGFSKVFLRFSWVFPEFPIFGRAAGKIKILWPPENKNIDKFGNSGNLSVFKSHRRSVIKSLQSGHFFLEKNSRL